MGLRILCAGASDEQRVRAERQVKAALGSLPADEPWLVSLVRIGGQWAVTLDSPDPELRGKHLSAADEGLRDSLVELLRARQGGQAQTVEETDFQDWEAPTESGPLERRDPHLCPSCAKAFVVVYEAAPDEPQEVVAVACPHCWQVDRATVARSAALGRDYRADRLEA
jgi:hypothetical protein